ncbi:MAG: 2-oxoacid:acceptor oxidoreductase family protein [Deltaproteobacteria bacterium]|nr:2-oxoacid:acceptor oxidoreductase family protein [Deltaproteobacteria bacterium]
MQYEVIIAGFGGQGVMLIGQLLANAAMLQGSKTVWMPSYGPEMRGGTANCTVVVSDEDIGSPVVPRPGAAIVMNLPSMDKFEPLVVPGGLLVVNASLVARKAERTDLDVVYVECNRLAEEQVKSPRSANMIALGAYIGKTGAATPEIVKYAMAKKMVGKERFLEANKAALDLGIRLAQGEAG